MYQRRQNPIFVLGKLNTNLFQNGKYVGKVDILQTLSLRVIKRKGFIHFSALLW